MQGVKANVFNFDLSGTGYTTLGNGSLLIYGLFNDMWLAPVVYRRMLRVNMNNYLKRKWSWPDMRYYPGIFLEALRKYLQMAASLHIFILIWELC